MESNTWYLPFAELQDTASHRDGVSWTDEIDYRRKTCMFIDQAAQELKLPKLTIATAQVYFHRFFMRQSFKTHDRTQVAATCLFLAGKVEETFKHLDNVVEVYHSHRRQWKLDRESDRFQELRTRILSYERILLHTMAFDLVITHPYQFLTVHIKRVMKTLPPAAMKKSIEQLEKQVVQVAWNFVNDSFRTPLCLQYSPEDIARATVYLSCLFCNIIPKEAVVVNGKPWWRVLEMSDASLDDICGQLMDLYANHAFPSNTRLGELSKIFPTREQLDQATDATPPRGKEVSPPPPGRPSDVADAPRPDDPLTQ